MDLSFLTQTGGSVPKTTTIGQEFLQNTITGIKQGSDGLNAVLGAAKLIPVYGQALAIVTGLIGKETINKTLGAVFANGFDFSCWGSATDAKTEKAKITSVAAKLKTKLESATATTIGAVLTDVHSHIIYEYRGKELSLARRSWAKCTEKGWEESIKGFKKLEVDLIEPLVSKLKENGFKVTITDRSVSQQSLEDKYEPTVSKSNTTAEKNGNITIKEYHIEQPYMEQLKEVAKNNKEAGGGFMVLAVLGLIFFGMKKFKK